ncbi:hypothetical protein NDN08_007209 [Rhodosorus marinus]|uniref:C2H2-type domain-containing protein n=1 Tax=Rhodosorus marinus TaxID=101924 RepID=A0AAV8UIK4_9RHOD|nr:hypothetical protein NDN08_007209 [Rhodosorus marinus]
MNGLWLLRDELSSDLDVMLKATFTSETEAIERVNSQIEACKLRKEFLQELDLLLSEPNSTSGTEESLRSHKKHKCQCGISFRTFYQLTRHKKWVHEGRKEYSCGHCSRRFSQSGHRNEHERQVHLRDALVCEYCGKMFGIKSRMDRHIRAVHENVRDHECTLCGKMFKERNHLQKHLRCTHSHESQVHQDAGASF